MVKVSISHESVSDANFLLYSLAALWRERGITVEIGQDFAPDANLGILHHNYTRLNPSDIPPAPDGVKILNSTVLDISKRNYSELMLGPSDDWDGPVIVKTNDNHFGAPDQAGISRSLWRKAQKRLARHHWKVARHLPHKQYPVLDTLRDVPDWVWQREDLLVERFLPEREGDLYAIRGWIFFGAASYGYRMYATDPAVKVKSIVRHDYIYDVPPELEAARQRMGFDYGKFDYVVHDGRAILFDANKTPTFAGDPKSERIRALADAVTGFLP